MAGVPHLPLNDVATAVPFLKVLQEIGSGGFKRVFEAVDEQGQRVALKIIPVADPRDLSRISREIQAMERVHHPRLASYIASGETRVASMHVVWVVEEFVEGLTMAELLLKGVRWNETQAVAVGFDLLNAVDALHKARIVHRDIKPPNIVIRPDGTPVLLDLGISRHLSLESLTPTYWMAAPGTPGFCAPEQLLNQKRLQDCRTDLYCIGLVLFVATSGCHPFDLSDGTTVPDAIIRGKHLDLSRLQPQLSAGFVAFVHQLLARHPHQRFRTPEQAINALQRVAL